MTSWKHGAGSEAEAGLPNQIINQMGVNFFILNGFHTPEAVTYHEPTVIWLFMIGHSLGRMETCVAHTVPSCWVQNVSQIKIFGTILKNLNRAIL